MKKVHCENKKNYSPGMKVSGPTPGVVVTGDQGSAFSTAVGMEDLK